jgi:hypothetical protein
MTPGIGSSSAEENNAQRASSDSRYRDSGAKRTRERFNGADYERTDYSDGSSTVHHGGPCGSTDYDHLGREC